MTSAPQAAAGIRRFATAFTGLAGASRELNLLRKTRNLEKGSLEFEARALLRPSFRESFRPKTGSTLINVKGVLQ
jgi:hypothetical protein